MEFFLLIQIITLNNTARLNFPNVDVAQIKSPPLLHFSNFGKDRLEGLAILPVIPFCGSSTKKALHQYVVLPQRPTLLLSTPRILLNIMKYNPTRKTKLRLLETFREMMDQLNDMPSMRICQEEEIASLKIERLNEREPSEKTFS